MGSVEEWVEAAGSTVDIAVEAALAELGLSSRDEADIEVISEGKQGILGSGWRAQDAVVKVTARPQPKRKRRRRGGRGRSGSSETSDSPDPKQRKSSSGDAPRGGSRQGGGRNGRSSSGAKTSAAAGGSSKPGRGGKPSSRGSTARKSTQDSSRDAHKQRPRSNESGRRNGPGEEPTIEEQATIAAEFLRGLLKAFGLEGDVATTIDEEEELLKIEVTGDQTEALVGRKGVVMQSVLEITRTVVQRKTFGAPRMRIDINGYGERRREALRIYAGRQAERIVADGGEIMLEPMNSADRKVVHDAIAEIGGVRSYSEGEDPERAVVIASD